MPQTHDDVLFETTPGLMSVAILLVYRYITRLACKAVNRVPIAHEPPVPVPVKASSCMSAQALPMLRHGDPSIREQALKQHESAFEASLTSMQREGMRTFCEELQARHLMEPWWDNALLAFRFCKARESPSAAADMFEAHIEWRKQHGLQIVCDEATGRAGPRLLSELRLPRAELDALKRARKFTFHKVDFEGRPMFYDKVGELDLGRILKVTTLETLVKHFIWHQEATLCYRLPAASLAAGRLIFQSVFVLDLEGFSLGVFTSDMRELLKLISQIGALHYPTTMSKTYVINAPTSFRVVWAFLSPLLPKRVIEAFEILGGRAQYMPKLEAHCDRADLPSFLGGDDESCDFITERGPWASFLPPLVDVGESKDASETSE